MKCLTCDGSLYLSEEESTDTYEMYVCDPCDIHFPIQKEEGGSQA